MVARQLRRRGVVDERVLEAMGRVPRELFVPPTLAERTYDDAALPIGYGQTISQPFVVASMLALAAPCAGDAALDVGTGSGYAAAVLATLGAHVVGVELVPDLAHRARAALHRAGVEGVEVRVGDGRLGAPDAAPFDVILVAAATAAVPQALLDQLADRGRLVLPLGGVAGQVLVRLERRGDAVVETRSFPCRFVPLLSRATVDEAGV